MRKLLVIALLAIGMTANAQISQRDETEQVKPTVIGFNKTAGILTTELSHIDNDYWVVYRDMKFLQIIEYKTLVFKATPEELDGFYNSLKQILNSDSEENKTFDVGNNVLIVGVKKMLGIKYLSIAVNTKGVIGIMMLSNKQLDKLFNKLNG